MFEFNKRSFKENSSFLLFLVAAIVIIFIITLFFPNETNKQLQDKDLAESGDAKINKLVINEVMLNNGGALADSNGNLYDWLELYNGKNSAVNLKNYGLSDRENEVKWVFPDVTIEANSYMIVFLSGTNESGLYANFKLNSSGGEVLALKSPSGKVVDAITTVATKKNNAMARDLDGNWFNAALSTPGFANTNEGYLAYQKSLKIDDNTLKISEVLPRNKGNFKNQVGIYAGYVEITNISDKIINLKNYSISNTWQAPFRFQLPNIYLNPNEVYTVYMDEAYSDTLTYAGFKLDAKIGTAILANNKGQVIDFVDYENLANGIALVRENNQMYETNQISPGYPNSRDGVNKFSSELLKNPDTLIINEVMNSNSSYLAQNGDNYYDWIELKNNSNKDIKLSDYYITTNEDLKTMYKLPEVTLKPNELYILIASGETNLSNNSYYHANFKISDVESLYIVKDNKISDAMLIANVPLNYSMGRGQANGFYYFAKPTPGSENGSGVHEVAFTPTLNKPGIYNNVQNFQVDLAANGTIYYTLDGSNPTTSSSVYSGPIFLSKTTVVKAISYEEGKLISPVAVASYIINENHELPVMSVSLKPADFSNLSRNNWVEGLEFAAYAELYEDGKSFSIPCGFRLFGGSTRGMAKKSFALKFRKQYGEGELHYQVFDNRDSAVYNTLVLRSGSQDSEAAMMRDVLMTSLVDGVTNLDVQAYKPVILYINGNYWGIYNIREKVDAEFISNHYNVSKNGTNIVRIDDDISEGSIDDYYNLINYMSSHNLSNSSYYDYVKSKLNIESFADFWAAETYVTNNDIINTRFFSNPAIDDGRIHMIFYDLDYAMYNYSHNYYNFSVNPYGMSDFNVSTLMMRSLIKNSEFKKTYLTRIAYQLKNVWNKERVLTKIDELYNLLKNEMPRNQERWDLTMKNWEDSVNELRTYVQKREDYMLSQTKSFFGLSDSEMKEYFGD